jgi:CheY-like chemotaxis protein
MERAVTIVLVIDDDPMTRATTVSILRGCGCSVVAVRDAEDALDTFRAHHTDIALILANAPVPKADGIGLLREIRTIDAKAPVVLMTTGDGAAACHELDVAGVLCKPFPADQLVDLVRRTLYPDRVVPGRLSPHSTGPYAGRTAHGLNITTQSGVRAQYGRPVSTTSDFEWPPPAEDLEEVPSIPTYIPRTSYPTAPSATVEQELSADGLLEFAPAASPRASSIQRGVRHRPSRQRKLRDRVMKAAVAALCFAALTSYIELRSSAPSGDHSAAAEGTEPIPTVPDTRRFETMKLVTTEHLPSQPTAAMVALTGTEGAAAPRDVPKTRIGQMRRTSLAASGRARNNTSLARERPAENRAERATRNAAERDIHAALKRYARAYERLDPKAARAVWPSADTRALERSFKGLRSQQLEFARCEVAIVRAVEATAICDGRATYVPLAGRQRQEAREWTFRFRKIDEDWMIVKADAR